MTDLGRIPLITNDLADESIEDDCLICLYKISQEDPYAKIDNDLESNKKYHIECLEKWFSLNKKGILTRDKINSYTLYHRNTPIQTVKLLNNIVCQTNTIPMLIDPIYPVVFVPDGCPPMECTCNCKCLAILSCIILILLIIMFFYLYG